MPNGPDLGPKHLPLGEAESRMTCRIYKSIMLVTSTMEACMCSYTSAEVRLDSRLRRWGRAGDGWRCRGP